MVEFLDSESIDAREPTILVLAVREMQDGVSDSDSLKKKMAVLGFEKSSIDRYLTSFPMIEQEMGTYLRPSSWREYFPRIIPNGFDYVEPSTSIFDGLLEQLSECALNFKSAP